MRGLDFDGGIDRFMGLNIREDDLLVVGTDGKLTGPPFEDWSQVRSPSRARRRRKHPNPNIRYFYKPDPNIWRIEGVGLVGHPATVRKLLASVGHPAAQHKGSDQ